jgi:dTDP-4-amino-4,6-dideoxygalactose transaminase
LPVTERVTGQVVSLPIYPELTVAQQDRVIETVLAFYQ